MAQPVQVLQPIDRRPGFGEARRMSILCRRLLCLVAALACMALGAAARADGDPLRIGSKRFTEAYILAELLAQTARPHGPVELKAGLGNTAITYEALRSGAIDVYPEYTGTIALEILKDPQATTLAALRERLAPLGLGVDVPLGFNNGYALAMRDEVATQRGIRTLSDLARHPDLRLGLSHEFIGRADGWPGLARVYVLPQRPQGLEHGLAYDALAGGQVDAIDIYTTDAQIGHRRLRVLVDDRAHFPRYDAVLLYRLDLPQRHPAAWRALQALAGTIDEATMVRLNARAEIDQLGFDAIVREYRRGGTGTGAAAAGQGFVDRLLGPDLPRLALQHVGLVVAAVALATVLGVPLAVAASGHAGARALLLGTAGVLQTVPALALLAVADRAAGSQIGTAPALAGADALCAAAHPAQHRRRAGRRAHRAEGRGARARPAPLAAAVAGGAAAGAAGDRDRHAHGHQLGGGHGDDCRLHRCRRLRRAHRHRAGDQRPRADARRRPARGTPGAAGRRPVRALAAPPAPALKGDGRDAGTLRGLEDRPAPPEAPPAAA